MKKTLTTLAVAGGLLAMSGIAQADGKQTVETSCVACHAAGVAGAPKLGNKEDWAPRMAMTVDQLAATVKTGKNAMPPMGACPSCTDDDLKAAVEYMLSLVK
ncbi:MAG: cytochrome c5 family protein [Ectothiorhodospiraceae bacterium]|nr:cytochrome c5 family protein [Chromatiales bacterium]MCP5155519.1 cytochrome c5 family protein [Ectothiorhodospiraceae bacterium]